TPPHPESCQAVFNGKQRRMREAGRIQVGAMRVGLPQAQSLLEVEINQRTQDLETLVCFLPETSIVEIQFRTHAAVLCTAAREKEHHLRSLPRRKTTRDLLRPSRRKLGKCIDRIPASQDSAMRERGPAHVQRERDVRRIQRRLLLEKGPKVSRHRI